MFTSAAGARNFILGIRTESMADSEIRAAIKQVIIGAYPNARVYSWNALSHKLNEWAGMFRCTDGKTHGWIIKRAATQSTWKNAAKDRTQARYDIWGFYGFRHGKDADNSDNEFSEVLDTIFDSFKDAPRLNFDNYVEKHDLLQFPVITTIESGEETLHFAQGRLTVHLCC